MELYENRVLNGLLKDADGVETPDAASALLSKDVEIYVDPSRVHELWPCIWALTSVLSKQFSGRVFVRVDEDITLCAPNPFSGRVITSLKHPSSTFCIGLGAPPPGRIDALWGDAAGNRIAVGHFLPPCKGRTSPISCYALAGYLGFAALARVADIPPFRERFSERELMLPFLADEPLLFPEDGVAFLGLGQLGQAYLSLLFFLAKETGLRPRVSLVDKDTFEPPNEFTQVLLTEEGDWQAKEKASYLAQRATAWGFNCSYQVRELKWGFRREVEEPRFAMLGFDDFEARRIAIESGYEWIVDGGVGTSFAKPRITWHSLPPSRVLASRLFCSSQEEAEGIEVQKPFFAELRKTPGECGWITFKNTRASAPCMGLVAAAFAWAEMKSVLGGERMAIAGSTYLWSPLLPFLRSVLQLRQ